MKLNKSKVFKFCFYMKRGNSRMKTQKIVYYFHMNKEEQKNEKRKKLELHKKCK